MKATVTSPSAYVPIAKDCTFKWYHVKDDLGIGVTFYALPSKYGVIYINEEGQVSYSSRDFFNDTYTVLKEAGKLTITFTESN